MEMMRRKTKYATMSKDEFVVSGRSEGLNCELRPGGMLVQKRDPDSNKTSEPAPLIRVRVKYGSSIHEITVSSQATFGELKKILSAQTGLHHQDQKILFKDKEKDSNSYLDTAGVKDRSKLVLLEDQASRDKRLLEIRKNAKMEKISKTISEIRLEVDKLVDQVFALESSISGGNKVAEKELLNLIELLMTQLIKLDAIVAEGDAKTQRRIQVRRVQVYVEKLDALKIKNAAIVAEEQGRKSQSRRTVPSMVAQPSPPPPPQPPKDLIDWVFFE